MATILISVSKNGNSYYPPLLNDSEGHTASTETDDQNFTTELQPGDTVQWIAGEGIRSIDNVFENTGDNNNLFDPNPAPTNGVWEGVVRQGATGTEEYSITYTGADGNQYTQDPKLTIGRV